MFTDTRRLTRKPSRRQLNAIDRQIEAIVRLRCSGIPIDVMKIGQVFEAGYTAHASGSNLEAAIVATYHALTAKD